MSKVGGALSPAFFKWTPNRMLTFVVSVRVAYKPKVGATDNRIVRTHAVMRVLR